MKTSLKMNIIIFLQLLLISCSNSSIKDTSINTTASNKKTAKIVSVSSTGNENNYSFNVAIASPDKGCNQYANWWEVISEDGTLIYRRILGHSHVDEQPFVRSGGKINIKKDQVVIIRVINIKKDQVVIIRVHMNNLGYSTSAFKGTVNLGFSAFEVKSNFASNLANQKPLPTGCAF